MRQRAAASANHTGYSSQSRKAASGSTRAEESSIPLQSGNSSSPGSTLVADSSDFFIQFDGAVSQTKLANVRIVHIEAVYLCQTYRIVHVLHNSSRVTVFDRVTFQREQMQQSNHPGAGSARRCGHGVGSELGKRSIVHEHQVKWQCLRIRKIELEKRRTFAVQAVAERPGQVCPRIPIGSSNDQFEVEFVAPVAMRDHGVAPGDEK